VTFTAGSATRIAYGPLVVWDYGAIVPPPVLQVRTGEAKIFAVRGGVAHVYYPQQRGKVVADLQLGGRNVAIVDRSGDNVAAVSAIQALRHPGSP
jgi:hypothetical protein